MSRITSLFNLASEFLHFKSDASRISIYSQTFPLKTRKSKVFWSNFIIKKGIVQSKDTHIQIYTKLSIFPLKRILKLKVKGFCFIYFFIYIYYIFMFLFKILLVNVLVFRKREFFKLSYLHSFHFFILW